MVVLSSFAVPTEGVEYRQSATEAHVGSSILGNGTLYVTQSVLAWMGDNGQGFTLQYSTISVHAISRDLSSFPKECLYLMVDGQLDEMVEEESSDDEGNTEVKPFTEFRFAPADPTCLDSIYTAMCSCQALHPDSDASIYSDDGDVGGSGDHFQDADDDSELTPQGRATLRHLESIFRVRTEQPQDGPVNGEAMDADEPGQFEDAD